MKKRFIFSSILAVMLMFTVVGAGMSVSAHGFIMNPESRAFLGSKGINKDVGEVQFEPQSVEGPKGFPYKGPADGWIASGGNARFHELDEQTIDRWHKVDVPTGPVEMTWTLTQPHRSQSWHYFITKNGWDPNKPLSRDQLQEIIYIPGGAIVPDTTVKQTINIPKDHVGYHVIVGIWSISDTPNAFYQVIDANIINPGKKVHNKTVTQDRWYMMQ